MTKSKIRVVAAQIERNGRYLITQRKPTSSLPLLWEFPGGRVEEGETDEEALARELREEMAIEVRVEEPSVAVTHEYNAYVIDFRVYRCRLLTPPEDIRALGVHDVRWVHPTELDDYEFPGADQQTVDALLAED
ncbi:MAG TPA: (deoxy)nucleoside triphosphate pyrophosphohydrolase [Myxococcales bacterium LLY-WYZ-16_1]|nr:(deoxy)nucleoside triphosphate pyrophosphohydrolase [Myxococcales bacterium LLY-WYZ-16_1]